MNALRLLTLLLVLLISSYSSSYGQFEITGLKAEYRQTPLGIDVERPHFSWQMIALEGMRGYVQAAYQIVVNDESGEVVWDSDRMNSDVALGIAYDGQALKPTTRYTWNLTVWDQDENKATASSWFETGLMDPNESAWQGAQWIGGSDEDMVLYSQYLSVFKINFTLQLDASSGTTRAAFVLGANDSRLMERNKNLYGLENRRDESFLAFELDISEVDGSDLGLAMLNIYRAGYHPDDVADRPLKQFPIPASVINTSNKYEAHEMYLESIFGSFVAFVNGHGEEHRVMGGPPGRFGPSGVHLNPMVQGGNGGDYIGFPMVADIGFSVPARQKAHFSNVQVRNYRAPSNPLFSEDVSSGEGYSGIFSSFIGSGVSVADGAYVVDGGQEGVFAVSDPSRNAMPMLRTEFDVQNKPIKKARLYATARGIYELYLNGERVGNDYFAPGLTQYNITHMYQTYDVTDMLNGGSRNAMGALLGEGWWSGNITFSGRHWNFFGDRQSLLSLLVVTYEDGSTDTITSSPDTWRFFNDGPIRYGSFFQGEVYDATLEAAIAGWDRPDFDDSNWKRAEPVSLEGTSYSGEDLPYDRFALIGQTDDGAKVVLTRTAQSVHEVRPGVFVYDMGQNMVGLPEIPIKNGEPGQTIKIRYAEVTYPDLEAHRGDVGMVMMENIRSALTQDIYTLKGGDEVIAPRFTFHGFRYLEITGIEKTVPVEEVKVKVISSITDLASSYETSNPKVNKLWSNITWSMRSNFLSIPTDTPARNERMGWGGDVSVFSRTSTYLADAGPFLRKHMLAMRDMQRADGRFADVAPVGGGFGGILWGSAGITVAWEAYQQYGDKAMIAEHYDAMKRYMAFLESRIDSSGVLNEGPLGDWLSPEQSKNDNTLLWSAYYVFNLEMMAKIAEALGEEDDAAMYWAMYESRKVHFNQVYVDAATGKTMASGARVMAFGTEQKEDGDLLDSQASYAVPLALGVFDENTEPLAAQRMVETVQRKNMDDQGVERPEYSLMTGFIGTAWINKALSDHGNHADAYRLLQQTSYPSWLYPVDQGATTIWERLNSYTIEDGFGGNNSMNSFNHYSFGAVGAWMYNYSLGITRDESYPGFKHFVLQPTPDPEGVMTWARGHYDSMYGRIESDWRIDGSQVVYNLTVPANTTATLHLPANSAASITENGMPAAESMGVSFIGSNEDRVTYELVAGTYQFITPR